MASEPSLELLVDVHVGGPLYSRLQSHFITVRSVDVLDSDADDDELWRYAVDNRLIIFTNDVHFVNGTADPGDGTHPGVIRYTGRDWKRIHQALLQIDGIYSHENIVNNNLEIHVPGNWA